MNEHVAVPFLSALGGAVPAQQRAYLWATSCSLQRFTQLATSTLPMPRLHWLRA